MDQITIEAPFLSTAPTRGTHRYAALTIIFLSLLGAALVAPFANSPWHVVHAFIPADDAGLVVLNLITAMLLTGQFRQLGKPSLLVLACAYFFGFIIVFLHLLVYPGILTLSVFLHVDAQTAARVYVWWHGLSPIFLLVYALLADTSLDAPFERRHILPAILIGFLLSVALVVGCGVISTMGPTALPVIIENGKYSSVGMAVSEFIWLPDCLALIVLYARTRARRLLDLWLCVVLVAWLLELVMAATMSHSRYTFGWYAGRFYGALAASLVLSALIIETVALYARVLNVLAEIRMQSAQLAKSEEALRQAQKMEAIGQLTGGVAHDFNNLLTVIIGSLDLIQSVPDDAVRVGRLAKQAMAAAARAEQLTKQLLTFARRQIIRPKTVDLNRVIRDFGVLIRTALGGAIEMHVDLGADLPPVRIDPAQFEAAMLNLAVNARDAMNGAGKMTIETGNVTLNAAYVAANPDVKPGNYVLVSVTDTGMGMDADTLSRVFEPFFTTKEIGKGSGLGLSQVYGFVKSSGGHTKIVSKPGSGTQVNIYLPSATGEALSPEPVESSLSDWTASAGETILIVDDDAGVVATVAENLHNFGYKVITAGNAAQALELIRKEPRIDLLFSDVMMPGGVTGVRLAVEARRLKPTIKILLASGYAADVFVNDHDLPSDVQIIGKPYHRDELANRLRSLLDAPEFL